MKLPGFIDVHVHMREPGAVHKEDWESGTAAALAGGFTCVLAMPNTQPPVTDEASLARALQAASQKARCDYAQFLGAGPDNTLTAADLAPRCAGLKLYLDQTYGPLRLDEMSLWQAHFERWPARGAGPVVAHAEGRSLAAAILMAELCQRPLHLAHVSTREEILLIRKAKERGLAVTCEVAPHHLFLTQEDLPRLGFGRSDQPDRPYTIPFYQDAILELMEALYLPKATLVGHSMGAVIAHSIALQFPERVERLVLISGSLVVRTQKFDLGTLLFLVPGLGEWLYKRLRQDPQAAYRSLETYYHRLEDLSPADRQFLFQRVNERVWSEGQRRAFFSTLRNMAAWVARQQGRLANQLSGLQVPTQVIWGKEDRVNPVENAQALLQVQPEARLTLLDGAGHNLHQERPEEVVQIILSGSGDPDGQIN